MKNIPCTICVNHGGREEFGVGGRANTNCPPRFYRLLSDPDPARPTIRADDLLLKVLMFNVCTEFGHSQKSY